MDYAKLASQLIRRLRGRRSQMALSKRLGSRSNVLYNWESGESAPTTARFFSLLDTTGRRPHDALRPYLANSDVVNCLDLTTAEGVAALFRELRGKRTLAQLSEAVGRDRFAVSRWLSAKTEPKLPDFLAYFEATTLSLIDFLAGLVDPEELDEAAERWRALQASRRSARELPWSHAILRGVDLQTYQSLPKHRPGFFASQLGLTLNDEKRCLELLCQTGDLVWDGTHYKSAESLTVDTGRDPETTRRLAGFWMEQGAGRVVARGEGHFAFNVFGVSRQDLDQLKELQRAYFAELRAIVARSESTERVVVATYQLFPLLGER